MEGDRNAYAEEAAIKIAKQRKVIKALRKEHEILLGDYTVAASEANRIKDLNATRCLDRLLQEYDESVEMLNKEKDNLKEINLQIRKVDQISHSFY